MDTDSDDENKWPQPQGLPTEVESTKNREARLLDEDRRMVDRELTAYLAEPVPNDAGLHLVTFWEVSTLSSSAIRLAQNLATNTRSPYSTIGRNSPCLLVLHSMSFQLKHQLCHLNGSSLQAKRLPHSGAPTFPRA